MNRFRRLGLVKAESGWNVGENLHRFRPLVRRATHRDRVDFDGLQEGHIDEQLFVAVADQWAGSLQQLAEWVVVFLNLILDLF